MALVEVAVASLTLCLGAERIGRERLDMEKNAAETLRRAIEVLAPKDTSD